MTLLNRESDLQNPVTMYVFSFPGFFRFDDVSRIRRSDISFQEGFMVFKVLKSKNDQLRKGDEVVISQLSRPACPVELLRRYLAMFKTPPDSKDLIFKPISRGKGCCKLVAPRKPISHSTIRGLFVGTCKVSELNRPSLVCILSDLREPLWQLIMM